MWEGAKKQKGGVFTESETDKSGGLNTQKWAFGAASTGMERSGKSEPGCWESSKIFLKLAPDWSVKMVEKIGPLVASMPVYLKFSSKKNSF